MKTEYSGQFSQKYQVIRCNENPSHGNRVVQAERLTHGRRDTTKLTVVCWQFCERAELLF